MKIDSNIKRNQLPLYVKQQLSFLSPSNIKSIVSVFTFILLDLSLLPLLYPMVNTIYFITLPMLVFVHLWAIRLLFKNPYSIQFETVLFIGSFGVVGASCYFILAQKIAYLNLGLESTGFYIVSLLCYIITTIMLITYQINKYANVIKKNNKGKERSFLKYGTVVALAPSLGYIIAQSSMRQSEYLMYIIMLAVSLFFSILLTYFAVKYFHKYFFMKANMDLVNFQKPLKKDRKKYEAKGIVIK